MVQSVWTQETGTSLKSYLYRLSVTLWSWKKVLSILHTHLYGIKPLCLPDNKPNFLQFCSPLLLIPYATLFLFQWLVYLSTICTPKLSPLIICFGLSSCSCFRTRGTFSSSLNTLQILWYVTWPESISLLRWENIENVYEYALIPWFCSPE